MKKIYQKLALTGVLAALLLSAGCGGAKETSADETAGNVPAVAEQKTDSKADMELSETLEVDAGSSEAGTETLETNTETQTQGYTFTDDLGREVTVKSADSCGNADRKFYGCMDVSRRKCCCSSK